VNYLVDTNVISEVVKIRPDARVIDFLRDQTFLLPSLVFAELAYGIYRLDDKREERSRYINFIEKLKAQYQDIVVPVSMEIAELSGQLRASESRKGRVLSFADAVIASTAMQAGLTLVTRNTKDFEQLDIPLLNPFSTD